MRLYSSNLYSNLDLIVVVDRNLQVRELELELQRLRLWRDHGNSRSLRTMTLAITTVALLAILLAIHRLRSADALPLTPVVSAAFVATTLRTANTATSKEFALAS